MDNENSSNVVNAKPWDPESALQALAQERDVSPNESPTQLARRLFRENLPIAAAAVCHLAQYSTNDRIRLDSAKYIIERNIGRLVDVQPEGEDDQLKSFIGAFVKETEEYANNDSSRY